MAESIMKNKYQEPFSEWQKRNCSSCRFSDKKMVGTGNACCTYILNCELDDEGECKTMRIV